MGNRKTEEDKIERAIRGLLKLPENRRCINCNLLGPQYVCTTFSTFVCTNCSGIHREFTHRVKSVSMAKFTQEEVTALQAGGNECGILSAILTLIPVIYRDFEISLSKSMWKKDILQSEKQESYASRKSSSFQLEFRSPQSCPAPRSDDASVRYLYDESRSPKYTQKYSRHGGQARSPIKFEVVDDRFRDEDYRKSRLSNIESKLKQISIDGNKNVERSQLPVVLARPLGDMPRVNPPPLQVTHSEQKNNNPESSIDLSTKSQATHAAAGVGPEIPPTTQSNENNWAIFEVSTENNDPKTPNTDTLDPSTTKAASEPPTSSKSHLDLLLLELSCPVIPSGMSLVPSGDNNVPTTTTTVENASTWDFPPISIGQATASPNDTSVWSITSTPATELVQPFNEVPPQTEVSHAHKPSSMQYLPSVPAACSSTTQPTNSPVQHVVSNNQPSVAPSTTESLCAFTELSSQTTSKPTQETRPDVGSQLSKVETKSSGRKELPEDLFTSGYSSAPAPHAGWQNVQPHGMGYGMQYYHNAVPPAALADAVKSSNPFDVNDGRSLIHVSSLPCMASLHGVPPAVSSSSTGLMHASSLGSMATMGSPSPSYASPVPMGAYFDLLNEKQPPRPQRAESFSGEITAFGSLDPIQQSNMGYNNPKTSNSFSNTRGNPFD
ncbi:putative ADP-ribosylation factor GTPase-activating protein AGD14, partial [Mucuna pruriens]